MSIRHRQALWAGPQAVMMIRPRGLHLDEAHMLIDGCALPPAVRFRPVLLPQCQDGAGQGSGPYFYLPKLESHLEARLWNQFSSRPGLAVPLGAIKATVLIETLPAAFEMDEILYELREHVTGLNCGRWDYIFSFIKRLGKNKRFLTPDRGTMTMDRAFLRAYSLLLIKTCHRRGAFAMGGMAAQIPNRKDEEANRVAFARVAADKEREVRAGHDGTWVAHPDLVPLAKQIFDEFMPTPNQLYVNRDDVEVGRQELLEIHDGRRTEMGFRENIRVGVQYIEAWLRGRGAVPIYNLMEDAATAEISRAQIWQWLKFGASLDTGRKATRQFFETCLAEEMQRVRQEVGEEAFKAGRFKEAVALFKSLVTAKSFEPFLTVPAYRKIV
jgi:malate synthase